LAPARKIPKKAKRGRQRVIRRLHKAPAAPEPPKAKPRLADYTYNLSEVICTRLANGETGAEVCRDADMPSWNTLCNWRRKHADFDKRYRIAREQGCEYYADEIVSIADSGENDYVQRLTAKGKVQTVFDRDHFERSRLRVDARKWTVSKILRHTYGDKSEVDLRTPDGLNVKVEERNALIDALVKLVHPKVDGRTKPDDKHDEPRER
jgi:hypothetical protein